jgi:pSer/pThr/pTyr-binding forkhead associated (FHA) protein
MDDQQRPPRKEADRTVEARVDKSPAATRVPGYVRATLRVLSGAEVDRVFVLHAPCTVIGRGPDADFSIDDPQLSRGHAAVSYHDATKEFRVADMKSQNGTLLNGSRVSSYALRHGDKLLVGDTLLVFEMEVGADGAGPG